MAATDGMSSSSEPTLWRSFMMYDIVASHRLLLRQTSNVATSLHNHGHRLSLDGYVQSSPTIPADDGLRHTRREGARSCRRRTTSGTTGPATPRFGPIAPTLSIVFMDSPVSRVTPDLETIVAFEFSLGAEIPANAWEMCSLPTGNGPSD